MSPYEFDPYDPDFLADPYPTYVEMRAHHAITYQDRWELTFFSRHADVAAILRDRRFGRMATHLLDPSELSRPEVPDAYPQWSRYIRGSFIDLEPPRHTRLRRLVAKAFTRRSAESYRSRLESVAEAAVENALERGRMEVIDEFATPIPLTMISELMGIPEADRQDLVDWSHAIVRLFDYNATDEEGESAERAVIEFVAYLRDILGARKKHPGPDLISELATVEDQGDSLSDDDLIATAILTLNAGHEATVHAIGNGIMALGANAAAFQELRRNPALAATAADELLRYDTPLQMFERWVLEDVVWGGHRLRAGTKVGLLFGSANRDPDRFHRPDDLALDRVDNPHVSFGAGIHYCVGAPLAKVELEAAFGTFAARVSDFAITNDPGRHPSLVFRGAQSIEIDLAG